MPSDASRVDLACDRFEEDWRAGRRPRIEDVLAESPEPGRPGLLCELLRVELELRRGAGGAPEPDESLSRFPAHAAVVGACFDSPPDPPPPPPDAIAHGTRDDADEAEAVAGTPGEEPGAGGRLRYF